MIFSETVLPILDNSGVRFGQVIRVYNKSNCATVGDAILITVKKYIPNKKIKKGMMYKALVIKTKKNIFRKVGQYIKANVNGAVLVKKEDNSPLAKRIKSMVFFEIRQKGFSRLVSMAPGII